MSGSMQGMPSESGRVGGTPLIRLLLVEDNPADVRLIREMLKEEPSARFELEVADRLSRAVAFLDGDLKAGRASRASKTPCDVVLLDLGLPDSRGLSTLEAVNRAAPLIPVVVLTGRDDTRTGLRAIEAGAQDYLVKGRVDPGGLVKTLLFTVERNRLLEALRVKSEALDSSRRSFQGIVEKSTDGIVVLNREGVVRFLNQTAVNQFRMDRDFLTTLPIGRPIVSGEMTEVDILRKDGSYGLAEMRTMETEWEGEPACLAMLRDITERRDAEARLVRQEKMAALGRLSSMVGHEIRTPLGTIRNAVAFVGHRIAGNGDEKVARHLRILEEEVQNIDRIIDDILGFARTRELDLKDRDPGTLVEEALKGISVPENVRVVRAFARDLEPILADPPQTRRAFRNLILNALEAMPGGGTLTLSVDRAEGEGETRGEVRFTFQDTGKGVPPGLREKVFEPLFTTKGTGTGLGLATVRTVVLAHHGTLEMTCPNEGGTTVTVTLPFLGGVE